MRASKDKEDQLAGQGLGVLEQNMIFERQTPKISFILTAVKKFRDKHSVGSKTAQNFAKARLGNDIFTQSIDFSEPVVAINVAARFRRCQAKSGYKTGSHYLAPGFQTEKASFASMSFKMSWRHLRVIYGNAFSQTFSLIGKTEHEIPVVVVHFSSFMAQIKDKKSFDKHVEVFLNGVGIPVVENN
uniref:Uncharacterized protein n=1 Tax=Romanomermis culicivorax TaxID=13658 RepID=A0A915KT32_ROMCU